MKVELTRFRVKPGKSERVDEWIDYINQNMDGVLRNLDDENMYVETIFREEFYGEEYIYWYSVKGNRKEDGIEPYIDPKHLQFMEECIDKTFRPQDMSAATVMLKRDVSKVIS